MLALLGHFYDPPVDPMMRAVLLDDWFEAIGGLPKVAIENGCRDYLAAPNRYRPHPGAIRSLALKHMPPLPREPEPRDETPPPTTAARKRVQKLVEDLAKRI